MRNCFLPSIPEIDTALDLLSQAADAYLAGDIGCAKSCLVKADMPEIRQFYKRIVGVTNKDVHWQSKQPKDIVPKSNRAKGRMPSAKEQLAIFTKDGWRCRFCGTRVISREARLILIKQFPEETHWVDSEYKRHTALLSQGASLDHVLPHSRGRTDDPKNFVTACYNCQFGRNNWTLEEVGFNDPRDRPPIVDEWDGLTRLLTKERALPIQSLE